LNVSVSVSVLNRINLLFFKNQLIINSVKPTVFKCGKNESDS
jgi:hypothetical protein